VNDFATLPVTPVMDAQNNPLNISFDLPGRTAYARIWKVQVGRVPLYLLETNVPQNSEDDRRITGLLYGSDRELRLKQEIVLGLAYTAPNAAFGRPGCCFQPVPAASGGSASESGRQSLWRENTRDLFLHPARESRQVEWRILSGSAQGSRC